MRAEGIFGEAVDRIGGEPISARMARKAPLRHLDPTLLLATVFISAMGALMVFSTTFQDQEAAGLDPNFFLKRQILSLIAGALLLVAVSTFDYRHLRGFAPIVYGFVFVGLVLVLIVGDEQNGATRWIDLGMFQAQPSELAKLALIVTLGAYFAERKGFVRPRDVALALVLVAIPSLLIYAEPDLGTMMVLVALVVGVLLIAGAKIRHFIVLGLIGLIATFGILQANVLEDYQVQRLSSFLDPNPDPRSEGYNLTQSKIAIGSGGVTGKGITGENTQTSLDFIPEQHTDFIFTAVGEQLGFVGSATLLGLFALLIWRALRIAALSRDHLGTLIAGGIAVMWAFQVFVNVGMTMGIMPITGIPLPFVSFGGSSLVTNYLAVALLLNIHMRRFLA